MILQLVNCKKFLKLKSEKIFNLFPTNANINIIEEF